MSGQLGHGCGVRVWYVQRPNHAKRFEMTLWRAMLILRWPALGKGWEQEAGQRSRHRANVERRGTLHEPFGARQRVRCQPDRDYDRGFDVTDVSGTMPTPAAAAAD